MAKAPAFVLRGIRNNNPMNLMDFGIKWKGLLGRDEDGYCRFEDPVMGIRAGCLDVLNDWAQDGKRTVRELITEFAPPSHKTRHMPQGNNTLAYINFVAKAMGVGPDDDVDLNDYATLKSMVVAIIKHENRGQQPYTDAQLQRAIQMAGVEPKRKPLPKSRTVRGGLIGLIGSALAAAWDYVSGIVEPLKSALGELEAYLPQAKYVLVAIIVLGILYMLWARIDDRQKGER